MDEGFLNGDYNSLPLAALEEAGGRGAAVRQDVQGVGDQLGLVQGGRQHLEGGGQRVVLCEAGEDDPRRCGGGVAARPKCAFAAFEVGRHSIFNGFSYIKERVGYFTGIDPLSSRKCSSLAVYIQAEQLVSVLAKFF